MGRDEKFGGGEVGDGTFEGWRREFPGLENSHAVPTSFILKLRCRESKVL
jgi:hypothetical protein